MNVKNFLNLESHYTLDAMRYDDDALCVCVCVAQR